MEGAAGVGGKLKIAFLPQSFYLRKKKNMQAISLKTTPEKFLLSIDRSVIDTSALLRLLERLRVESLAKKVDFEEDIEQLGEEIKADWWDKNKDRLINRPE